MFKNGENGLTIVKIAAFVSGLAASTYLIVHCYQSGDRLLGLLALTSAIFGWVVGMLAAPYSKAEKEHFSELAKIISGFVTGYLLSKLDPVIGAGGKRAPVRHRSLGNDELTSRVPPPFCASAATACPAG